LGGGGLRTPLLSRDGFRRMGSYARRRPAQRLCLGIRLLDRQPRRGLSSSPALLPNLVRMGAALSRDEWRAQLAGRVGARLIENDDLKPADDLVALGGRDFTCALIVASLATAHSNGHLLDAIVERIATGRLISDGVDQGDVATTAISTYRLGHFPEPKWWDAVTVEVALLECWADQALRSVARAEVEELLRDRWLVEESAISVLAEGLGDPGTGPLEEITKSATASPLVARILNSEETKTAMANAVDAVPEPFANHREIRDLASSVGFVTAVGALAKLPDVSGEADTRKELEGLRDAVRRRVGAQIQHLSVLEASALWPVSESERVLRAAVEGTRRRIHIVSLGNDLVVPNGLTDRLAGETLAADYLVDEVFSAGGRSGLLAWGPTAYMWLALERHEVPSDGELLPISIGVTGDGNIPFELILGIAEGRDPMYMSYRIGRTDETLRWLAMLVLSERLTIDVLEVDPSGHLRLLQRVTQEMKDLAAELRGPVVEAVEDAEPAPLLTGNELEEHVLAGFGLSENAKSEMLIALTSDAEAHDDDVVRTRRKLLDAHVARASLLYAGRDPTQAEARVEEAMRDYAHARSRVERRIERPVPDDPERSHRELVRDFARDGRAVVHYNFKSGHIQGFWSANGGETRGWLSGEQVDVRTLADAAKPWLEGRHGDVDTLLRAAEPLASELAEALGGVDADEVVVIPWAVLHGVPFAAIPVGDSAFGDRFRVSYAPSLAMLRPLVDAGDSARVDVELISAHGGSLRWADVEVAAANLIYPEANLTPDRSPREQVLAAMERGRIVHLATHGEWWRDDPFASSLDLRLTGAGDSHVSAAEIYRDVDLVGAELVTLSACDTGRSPSLRHGVETYSGLDAAFLAKGSKAVISTLWPIDDLAATLFMTSLHWELSSGETLPVAFERSVELLRSGGLKAPAADHPVGTLLDATGVAWREPTAQRADAFREARIWAAFKLSGIPWLSRPLDVQ